MTTLIDPLPAGWEEVPLGDCSEVVTGPSLPRGSRTSSEGVPVVAARNLQNNRISEYDIAMAAPETVRKYANYRLHAGDVVCVRTGELGRQAIAEQRQEGWLLGTACVRVRPQHGLNGRYLLYYLGHPVVRDWIVRRSTSSTVPSLNAQTFRSLPVAVPPQETQQAIAETLEALDDEIIEHERVIATATELRDELTAALSHATFPPPHVRPD